MHKYENSHICTHKTQSRYSEDKYTIEKIQFNGQKHTKCANKSKKKMNMEGRASSPLPKHNCENLTKHHSHSCNLKTTQRRGSHISHNQRK